MKLQNQVTSLKLSKKLKKLGVKQDSLFYWVKIASKWEVQWFNFGKEYSEEIAKRKDLISAFTPAELGEKLPKTYVSGRIDTVEKKRQCFCEDEEVDHFEFSDTEANARGEMLAYLIENKLIKKR